MRVIREYLYKAGKLSDNHKNHPLSIELPEDPSRTIYSLIEEINKQGYKLEIKASLQADYIYDVYLYIESLEPGTEQNSIVFTKTGCLSTRTDGNAETFTQGSDVKGVDGDLPSSYELKQNGYPVASRESNNVYEGVQVFNNVVALNNTVTGVSIASKHSEEDNKLVNIGYLHQHMPDRLKFFNCKNKADILNEDPLIMYKNTVFLDLPNLPTNIYDSISLNENFSGCFPNNGVNREIYMTIYSGMGYYGSILRDCHFAGLNLYMPSGGGCNYYMLGYNSLWSSSYVNLKGDKLTNVTGLFDCGPGVHGPKAFYLESPVLTDGTRIIPYNTVEAYINCPKLTNINILVAAKGNQSDYSEAKLTKLKIYHTENVTIGTNAFNKCTILPSNQFPTNWPALKDGSGMFLNCKLLDATTANAILDSLPDWSGDSITHTITFTGTAAATTWSADGADLSHVQAAEAKGWVVER